MKKFIKTLGIVCAVCAVLGIVLIAIGIINGGRRIIESDLKSNNLAVYFNPDDWFDDEDDNNMSSIESEDMVKLNKEEHQIHSMSVNAKYGEVKVIQWEEDYFGIENHGKLLKTKYDVKEGILSVSVSGKVGIFHHNIGKIYIYIPKDTLNSMELSVGAGELECSSITVENMKIDVGAGEAQINYSQFGQCDIDVGLGELDMENTTVNSMDVDCGMGEVKAELNNRYDEFDYVLKVGAGEIELGSQKYEGISRTLDIANNTGRTMDIDCGMGEVTVKFSK